MNNIWFICSIPALLFSIFAQWYLKSTYSGFAKVKINKPITINDLCNIIISNENLNIDVKPIDGELTDSYDSDNNILYISESNQENSLASISVIAHELGHALQDKNNYYFLRFRNFFVPVANIGSQLGYLLIMIGLIVGLTGLTSIGLVFFSGAFIFTIITLPVEINASNRAINLLTKYEILDNSEIPNARKILNAAALTYIAAIAASLSQLIYLTVISNKRRG